MRIAILALLLLFTVATCAWNGAGRLPRTTENTQASAHLSPVVPAPDAAVPGSTPLAPATFSDADFERHVESLKKEIKSKLTSSDMRVAPPEFVMVIQRPFVVIGDENKQAVQEHATATVKWAVERLKQDFFTNDPKDILEIWLFKDAASYEKHARLFFGDKPSTPYGYYSSAHKALIMNIETGGGTLVHEIVHPFIEANFPACPPWLNEGLGSLYEQCGEANGHIHGFTNWRLPGLQQAIKQKQVPEFKELTSLDANGFYNEDKGVNYAQARYLCYYLQQKGLLVKFYQQFLTHQREDPTGFKTLQKVLAETDMEAFKTKWEKYVLTLRQGYEVAVE